MSMSNDMENNLLKLLFQNTTWANIGDAGGLGASATAGNFYVGLHTADPGEGGTQATSQAAYGNYARVAVARSSGGWTVTNNVADNTAAITFAQSSNGPETETYAAIGRDSGTGAGMLLLSGVITSPASGLVVNAGITPEFAIGALDVTFE